MKIWFYIFFVGLCTNSALAQEPVQNALIPREVLFDLADRKEWIKLTPDAAKVFYIKGAFQRIPDDRLYYRHLDHLHEERWIKVDGGIIDYIILNNDEIIFRTLTPNGQSLLKYNLESKEFERLQDPYFRSLMIQAISSDRSKLVFLAAPFDGLPFLAQLNLHSKKLDTLKNMAQGHFPLFFDGDLNLVAGEKVDRETGLKSIDYRKNGKWQTIKAYEYSAERFLRPGLKSILGVSNDGAKIYFTDNTGSDKTELKAFDVVSEKTVTLVSEQASDLIVRPYLASAQNTPLAIANHYSKREWNITDKKVEADFEFFNSKMKDFHILDLTDDLNYWIVEELNGGCNIAYFYDRQRQRLQKLFSDHDALDNYPKVNRFYEQVSSFDRLTLPCQYYLSEKFDKNKDGLPDEQMPAIVYVHGGPWQGWMEDHWLINRHLQLLADRGYLVVYAQFRGALTYGKQFLDAGNEQWGDGMVKDNVAIADWLKQEKNIDKDRIGIFGWSYGGYAALAGAAFSPETFTCAISLYGPTYLDASREESSFGYSPNSLLRIADVNTEEGLALAHAHSPLYAAEEIDIPVLMSTGSKDDRVPQMQMDKMAEALHYHEKEVTYFIYPDEGHDYRSKASWTTFWSIAEPFLRKHLGGLAEPVQDEDYSIIEMKYKHDED